MAHINQCYLNPLQVYVTWESCFHCSWNASHFTCTQHEHCSLGFHITGSCHDDLHVELLMVSDVGPITLLAPCDWVATLEGGVQMFAMCTCWWSRDGKGYHEFHDPFTIQRYMVFYMEKGVDLVIIWYLRLHINIGKEHDYHVAYSTSSHVLRTKYYISMVACFGRDSTLNSNVMYPPVCFLGPLALPSQYWHFSKL